MGDFLRSVPPEGGTVLCENPMSTPTDRWGMTATPPMLIDPPRARELGRPLRPGAERLIIFHSWRAAAPGCLAPGPAPIRYLTES